MIRSSVFAFVFPFFLLTMFAFRRQRRRRLGLCQALFLSLSLFSLTDTLITVNQRSRCSPSELACSKSPFQVVERLQQQQQQQADTVSDEQKAHCHWQGTLDGCMQDAGQRKEKESQRASERAKEEAKRWWPTKASPKWQIV